MSACRKCSGSLRCRRYPPAFHVQAVKLQSFTGIKLPVANMCCLISNVFHYSDDALAHDGASANSPTGCRRLLQTASKLPAQLRLSVTLLMFILARVHDCRASCDSGTYCMMSTTAWVCSSVLVAAGPLFLLLTTADALKALLKPGPCPRHHMLAGCTEEEKWVGGSISPRGSKHRRALEPTPTQCARQFHSVRCCLLPRAHRTPSALPASQHLLAALMVWPCQVGWQWQRRWLMPPQLFNNLPCCAHLLQFHSSP